MVGINAQALRSYERRGLLPEPTRSDSGYRAYGPSAVRIVRFIKRARELGFSLADVEVLLELAGGGPDSCEAVRALVGEKSTELEAKIAHLVAMRNSLQSLVSTCGRPRANRECPLPHALDEPPCEVTHGGDEERAGGSGGDDIG